MLSSRRIARPPSLRALALIALSVATFRVTPASATWLANGSPVTPARTGFDEPFPLSMVSDGAGGSFVASGNTYVDATLSHIRGDGDLDAGWPSDGMSFLRYPLCPFLPVVISDNAGGAFVISNVLECAAHWAGNATELVVHHVDSNAAIVPGWPAEGLSIGSGFDRSTPILVLREPLSISNGRGSAIISWARRQSFERGFSPIELRVQRVDVASDMPWGLGGIVIRSFTALPFQQSMALDGSGGAYVFWLDDRAPGLFAQHVLGDGTVSWATDGIPVAGPPSTFAAPPVAISDGAHGAIVAWAGTRGTRRGVFAARLTPSGELPWRDDRAVFDAGTQQVDELRMVSAPQGGAILAWRASSGGTDHRILAQKIDREGRRRWPDSGAPVCEAVGSRDHLAMAPDQRGGAYFAWVDSRPAFVIYGSHLEQTGEPTRGWARDGFPVCARIPLAISGSGFAEVSELGMTAVEGPGAPGHKMGGEQRDSSHEDGTVEPEIRAKARDDGAADDRGGRLARTPGAIVAWVDDRHRICYSCDAAGLSPFAMLLEPDGPATAPIAASPSPVLAGRTQSSLARSAPSALSLRWRATAPATLVVNLPDASHASLELFDLAGRKLWWREVGQLGRGTHELLIGDGVPLPSGVYLAKLTQAGHAATARMALLH